MPTLNESSGIVSIGGSATPDAEGAYGQLIASVIRNTTWALIYCAPQSVHFTDHFLDIAIGGGFF